MNKRATVVGTDAAGHLLVAYPLESGLGGKALQRPIVGSSTTGLHTLPPPGAQLCVPHEGTEDWAYPIAAGLAAPDALGTPPALNASETVIYGARGEVLSYATASGQTILYQSKDGTLAVKADTATGRINITCADGLYINGVKVTVP